MDTPTKPKITAKDFFLHIGTIAALYVFATSFLSFMFDIINYVFPDRQSGFADPYSGTMRLALSTLIVSFPLLLALLRAIYIDQIKNPIKRELGLRKWLIYLTLFFTTITVAVDIIVLLNTFLGGEITTRFIWKILSVFVVAGTIFWASLSDLRGIFFSKPKVWKIFIGVSTAVVIASVIWGFMVIGSPMSLRNLRDDTERENDLQNIQWEVVNYYQNTGMLPSTLDDISDPISGYAAPTDPATGADYEYQKTAGTTSLAFQLCATFAATDHSLQSSGNSQPVPATPVGSPIDNLYDSNWNHDAGRTCFDRVINPQLHPLFNKSAPQN